MVFLPSIKSIWPGDIIYGFGNNPRSQKSRLNNGFGNTKANSNSLGFKTVEIRRILGSQAPPLAATLRVFKKKKGLYDYEMQ